jgi:hypothetical protein
MPNPHPSSKPIGWRAEQRRLRAKIKKVTAGFIAFLLLSIGLIWFYATYGIGGMVSVSSGRFGHGVSNSVWVVPIPFAAAVLLGLDLVRLRRRLRDVSRQEPSNAPACENPEG